MATDGFIERIFPGLARRYYEKRIAAATVRRYYEATEPSPQHPMRRTSSADGALDRARDRMYTEARWLDENSDIAVAVLDTLVNRIVGGGLMPAPMVQRADGTLYEEVNQEIAFELERFARAPDTTQENSWAEVQRLQCRSWLRDGEVFIQHISGGGYPFPGTVEIPYLIQSLEADFLPYDLVGGEQRQIVHGVEKGVGGIPIRYFFYREQPNAVRFGRTQATFGETIPIPAAVVDHLKFQRRLHQTRGVSILHSVMRTIEDVKEYKDSERIAARVAAAFCAVIQKTGAPLTGEGQTGQRFLEMEPGIIMDTLQPGESLTTLGSNRPNPNMADYVDGQSRNIAAATMTGYSTVSRNYDGSYSAQRQEMVETELGYKRLFRQFVDKAVSSTYRRWLEAARIAGAVTIPVDADERTIDAHVVSPPPIAWVDPLKETQADALAVEQGFTSRHAVIRKREGDPRRVDAERERDTFQPEQPEPAQPSRPVEEQEENAA